MISYGSLADCEAFADKFDNTCSSRSSPIDFANHVGEQISCIGDMYCPGDDQFAEYSYENPCTWHRKLCVTCSEDGDGKIFVRVQSNTLPNHCYENDAISSEVATDWTVEWQKKNHNYYDFARMDQYNSRETVSIPGCVKTDNGKKRFAIMIGMDGVKPSALEVANTPNIDRLVKNGMVNWEAVT